MVTNISNISKVTRVLVEFEQNIKSDLRVMSRGSSRLWKFKGMSNRLGGPKKVKSRGRGYPGDGARTI